MSKFFPEVKGNFGFGCLRMPLDDGVVNQEKFNEMIDTFLGAGFNYFDTAHSYMEGKSEIAVRDCLTSRYPHDKYVLCDKLTTNFFNKQEDIRPFFDKQLEWCGVDYFDFYLMHAQDKNLYPKYKECKAYETAYALKEEGLIRHLGISFHDKAELLDTILTEHPEIEVVQIQFNYVDYEDAAVESRKVYEVCEKYGKPVIVMEPVKGGTLVNLPADADKILRDLGGGSNASYAIRFAASFPNIEMVLSGMGTMDQLNENIGYMKDFKPLDKTEMEALEKVCGIFKSLNLVPCTACRYCIEENECPMGIRIPDMFSSLNAHEAFNYWNTQYYYDNVATGGGHGRASDCIKCGKCEKVCPQHLEIRKLLEDVAAVFDKKKD